MTAAPEGALGQNERVDAEPDRLAALFAELAAGRTEALEGIWELCAGSLHGLALWRTGSPADAADAVQEVFVRLAQRRVQLVKVRDHRAYLLAMAHRAAVDATRRRRPAVDPEACPFLEAPGEEPERRLDARRASRLLRELPPAQREAVYLRCFAGLTFAEAGRVTGVPTFTAASRYRLGIRRLRRSMGVEG